MTTQPSQSVLINGFGLLFVILNSFGLGLRLPIGKLLADAYAHWKIAVWALVINFVIIPLLFIGYLLTIASSIPGEIKVGFCVAALCAGMPFAPLLARLAKADVSISTTLLGIVTRLVCRCWVGLGRFPVWTWMTCSRAASHWYCPTSPNGSGGCCWVGLRGSWAMVG
jgi:predicted Na+-dependent transporter